MKFSSCEISETHEGEYWIGLKDMVGDNSISSYKWVRDGSMLTYQNWAPGEPLQSADACVIRAVVSGIWDDVACTRPFGAICEVDVCMTIFIVILQLEADLFNHFYISSICFYG